MSGVLNKVDVPEAWILRVAGFVEKHETQKLTNRLLLNGHKAFFKESEVDGQSYFRVYAGPHIDKRTAMEEKSKIDRLLKTNAVVMKYVP